jgi:hypothetical protein
MMNFKSVLSLLAAGMLLGLSAHRAEAWDYEAHRVVNQLALASLPTNYPAFALTPQARERIAFLSGEADRWRNTSDLSLQQCNGPDHYIDVEELADYALTPARLPFLRYDFVGEIAVFRALHPDKFPAVDSTKDRAHTRNLVGYLPWTITEYSAKLKSAFSYLKAYQEAGGTPDEIANAEANIVYLMGVMGHYVGDATQPLHTTMHFNGWAGKNTNHYTTARSFHQLIDGAYFLKTGGIKSGPLIGKVRPAKSLGNLPPPDGMFRAVVDFIVEQNKLVEPLYQLEKEGKLSAEGENGMAGRAMLENQVVKAAQMLGDIWLTAWQQAPEDTYLKRELEKRRERNASTAR